LVESPLSPGGWCAAEVVAHLADVELAMGFRLRQAVAGRTAVQAVRPGRLGSPLPAPRPDVGPRGASCANRAWNLALFATFDLDDWLTDLDHPERGRRASTSSSAPWPATTSATSTGSPACSRPDA
jgi:hypothetical protein